MKKPGLIGMTMLAGCLLAAPFALTRGQTAGKAKVGDAGEIKAFLISLATAAADTAQHPRPDIRELNFVAHQDDDLLFMNPDIQKSINAGHTVETVYLTAGACEAGDYYLAREAGVMAAYAHMAGVSNNWQLLDDFPIRVLKLVDNPHTRLGFFRLPEGFISGTPCGTGVNLGANLKALWSGDVQSITAVDGSATYTKDQLVAELASIIQDFTPTGIRTLDSSGFDGTGTDPSGITMLFSNTTGLCDWYDNSDHYYSAIFAGAAESTYLAAHQLLKYRGYNIGNEAANITGSDLSAKISTFQAYAEHDALIPSSQPPFCTGATAYCLYDNWQQREYTVDVNNPPNEQPCCPPGNACRPVPPPDGQGP